MNTIVHVLCAVAAPLLLSGCGPAALDGPTKGPVTDADVVGRWSYLGDFYKTVVEIEFTNDHHFTQIVTGASGVSKTQKGSWTLDGPHLRLESVLLNNSVSGFSIAAWNPTDSSWWFADGAGHLELMGGEYSNDPDQCNPLKRLGGVAAPKP
jgi:hypothetical protein